MKSSRNTQIIYPKDAALIVMFSGIGPGSRVIESGTGTGSLTTALAHYVGPTGKVYTYELRPEFQKNAAKNLERSKLIDHVEMKSGDVTLGYEERDVDAVILDLAVPWLVVPHAYTCPKTFRNPCIIQPNHRSSSKNHRSPTRKQISYSSKQSSV